MELSAGKLWSLRRLADRDGFFTMIAVDQRPGVEALVQKARAAGGAGLGASAWEDIGRLKRVLIEELSPHASAMLVDPQYALPYGAEALDPAKGLLVTLEQFACEEGPGGRKTLTYPGWSVADIKRLGAD
ncbi:MAG TPA: hypothetical protein VE650_12590, partial [Acetobacteraceae bacterium]|nr:hypothetical protein [Acetobacteraceae bacterium]